MNTNHINMPTTNTTANLNFYHTSRENTKFQQLNKMFGTILQFWTSEPTRFGYGRFDEFMAALPQIYQNLIMYQRLEQLRQQQLLLNLKSMAEQGDGYNVPTPAVGAAVPAPVPVAVPAPVPVPIAAPVPVTVSVPVGSSAVTTVAEKPIKATTILISEANAKDSSPSENQSSPTTTIANDNNNSNNPFSLLPATRGCYRKSRKVSTLAPIEEDKPSPACSRSPSPSPSHSVGSSSSMNAAAVEFVPVQPAQPKKSSKAVSLFKPKHAARAKLNIYIPKNMTKQLLPKIAEEFPNTNTLYYYLDISTALQINDSRMEVHETEQGETVVLVNYDLHCVKSSSLLYAVVVPNDKHKIEVSTEKWLWKISEFLTADEIASKYGLLQDSLPLSSRSFTGGVFDQFREQYEQLDGIQDDLSLLYEFEWSANEIKQIGSSQKSKKGKKPAEVRAMVSVDEWLHCCERSWNSWDSIPAIPIVVYENRDVNAHWLEWVKLVYLESQQSYVGVSFRFNADHQAWKVASICLDKGDMHNKHRLIALQSKTGQERFGNFDYEPYFACPRFTTRVTEMVWHS